MLPDGDRVQPAKGWIAKTWQGMDQRYIKPVLSQTPDNWGTDTLPALRQTLFNWWHGIAEEPPRSGFVEPCSPHPSSSSHSLFLSSLSIFRVTASDDERDGNSLSSSDDDLVM